MGDRGPDDLEERERRWAALAPRNQAEIGSAAAMAADARLWRLAGELANLVDAVDNGSDETTGVTVTLTNLRPGYALVWREFTCIGYVERVAFGANRGTWEAVAFEEGVPGVAEDRVARGCRTRGQAVDDLLTWIQSEDGE